MLQLRQTDDNSSGLFFKPRHFVPKAFPELINLCNGAYVLEIGAGNGSNATLLEILAPKHAKFFACDIASASLKAVSERKSVKDASKSVRLFLWDIVTGEVPAGVFYSPKVGETVNDHDAPGKSESAAKDALEVGQGGSTNGTNAISFGEAKPKMEPSAPLAVDRKECIDDRQLSLQGAIETSTGTVFLTATAPVNSAASIGPGPLPEQASNFLATEPIVSTGNSQAIPVHGEDGLKRPADLSDGVGSFSSLVECWCVLPAEVQGGMDATLLMFVLSAIHPKDHAAAVANVFATLKPGGLLCFRDYGLYDLAQLRAADEKVLTPRLHVRGDGTLAYYFSVDEVTGLLTAAGFEVQEAQYCTIRSVNRRKGVTLDRVWVHAKAVKPLPPAG